MPSISSDTRIAVIGLGYVGLPLAVAFGQQFDTLGFDISAARIAQLRAGHDHTRELSAADLAEATSSPSATRSTRCAVATSTS